MSEAASHVAGKREQTKLQNRQAILDAARVLFVERGYARLDWAVLHWNTPAREVYHALGAEPLDEWVPYRVEGDALVKLAGGAGDPLTPESRRDGAESAIAGSPIGPPAS